MFWSTKDRVCDGVACNFLYAKCDMFLKLTSNDTINGLLHDVSKFIVMLYVT